MRRVSNSVVVVVALACLASDANAGLIEVTVTGQVESLVDWPAGLVPGESVVFSYVLDADAPIPVHGTNAIVYLFQSSFFQAGNHSISATHEPPQVTALAIIDASGSKGGPQYQADASYFAAPFMNATDSILSVSLSLVDDTGTVFPPHSLFPHPLELDLADFNDAVFQATLEDFSGAPPSELMITPESIQIVAVPEPGTLALLALCMATAMRRRRYWYRFPAS